MTAALICGRSVDLNHTPFVEKGFETHEFGPYTIAIRKEKSIQSYEDNSVFVVLAGVVYLPPDGEYGFNQQAEYLASVFVANGSKAVEALFGHYFVCIVDKANMTMRCFGDPMGGRRVFITEIRPGAHICSSKLRVLAELNLVKPSKNQEYEPFCLVYGYFPNRQTIYRDVSRLLKSEAFETSLTDGDIIQGRHLESEVQRFTKSLQRDAVIDELYLRLTDVVNSSLRGTSEVAVLLGGFDSALVASLAARSGKKVRAYTFQYADSEFNQKNIDSVVSAIGIKHDWVEVDSSVIGKGLEAFSECFDRPTNWPNYVIQTKLLCEVAAKNGAEVGLTGDGCDEIFLGYPGIYRGAKFFGGQRTLPAWLVKLVKAVLGRAILEENFGHVHRLVMRVISNMGFEQRTRLYLIFRIMDESTISHLFGKSTSELQDAVNKVVEEIKSDLPNYPSTILAYEGRDHIVPNRLKLTGSMDATGLPLFSPYMHPRVRRYVRALPEDLLRPSGEAKRTTLGKDILLEMADRKGLLPHSVIYQPKHAAVDGPLDKWYEKEISNVLTDLISRIDEPLNRPFLRALLREKAVDKYYRKNHSVDSITCHAASLLATYGSFFKS